MTKKEQGLEESLKELKNILTSLENPELGVDDALKLYEKGVKLVRQCEKKLENARQTIKYIDNIGDETNE